MKLNWDYHSYGSQLIDNSNNYLDGGEILSAICPPFGYVSWATANLDKVDIIAWGYGDSDQEAKDDLEKSIRDIEGKLNVGQEDSSNN